MAVFLLTSAAVAVSAFATKGNVGNMHNMAGNVYFDGRNYEVVLGKMDKKHATAFGFFKDTLNVTGWGILDLATTRNGSIPDNVRMRAAGILEGFLTSYEIYRSYFTLWSNDQAKMQPYYNELKQWSRAQRVWMQDMIDRNPNDEYWVFAALLLQQYDGLAQGYEMAASRFRDLPRFSDAEFVWPYIMAKHEEWGDVIKKLNRSERTDWQSMSPKQALNEHLNTGHCSAIVKVTPKLDDLFMSHNTWNKYWTMNRIYKFYHLPLQNRNAAGERLTMSSYPGSLSSIDDWYQMDSGVVAMETTNSVYNTDLFDLLKPESMYAWQRTRISCFLAKTATEWISSMGRYNSGTYNNQWIALNYGAFEAEKPLPDELLMIGEQLPGAYVIEDMTRILERGYYPSYNVPATDEIYELSGTADIIKTKGVEFSYDMCPRARLYRAYANEANDIQSLKDFMQYNNYKVDPLENGYSNWAICARYDLEPNRPNRVLHGCTDTKLASLEDMRSLGVWVKGSPTFKDQPMFDWSDWPEIASAYLPRVSSFEWVYLTPTL